MREMPVLEQAVEPLLPVAEVAPAELEPMARLNFAFARDRGVILEELDGQLKLLCRSGVTPQTLLEVRRVAGAAFRIEFLDPETFDNRLMVTYQRDSSEARQLMEDIGNEADFFTLAEELLENEDLLDADDDAPIIRLINAMLSEAIKEEASDIHIETFERHLVIRFRIDGVLREILRPHRKLASLLVSRIKVMSKMDIAEKRVPQDGRIALRIGGRAVDVRVSTMPSSHGERVVLRLLDKQAGRLDVTCLGMPADTLARFRQILGRPHGIFLVTGPTGSGKTTSLYAALTSLNDQTRNILTVEDPIEYHLPGIGQTPVNPKVDMTFARGLRAILRQDPDVVMVGEIRDQETAEIAVQASLTGHLVLSTLHTNSAVGAVTRLVDMGVDSYLLASSLVGVLAQRLIRTLCSECKQPYTADAAQCLRLGLPADAAVRLFQARGCGHCQQGYRGRMGIYELLSINADLARLIHNGASEPELACAARTSSASLFQDGQRRVLEGATSLDELLRVTQED